MERKNKRERRKLKKQQQQNSGVTRHKRKRNLRQEDIDELAKDIALIKKLKRKKVRMVNEWFEQQHSKICFSDCFVVQVLADNCRWFLSIV